MENHCELPGGTPAESLTDIQVGLLNLGPMFRGGGMSCADAPEQIAHRLNLERKDRAPRAFKGLMLAMSSGILIYASVYWVFIRIGVF